jgi:hypothetical protein
MKTKSNIIDTPVTISGFIIGMLVTFITEFLMIPFFHLSMPTAAAVPIIVANKAEPTAKAKVLVRACITDWLCINSPYHLKEKPVKRPVLFEALNEKKIITAMGA